jgi:hypothetical protein
MQASAAQTRANAVANPAFLNPAFLNPAFLNPALIPSPSFASFTPFTQSISPRGAGGKRNGALRFGLIIAPKTDVESTFADAGARFCTPYLTAILGAKRIRKLTLSFRDEAATRTARFSINAVCSAQKAPH